MEGERKMKKPSMALLTLVALLILSSITLIISVSADPTIQEEPNNFTAQLDGDQEVPPRTTDATGQATFELRAESLGFTLDIVDIKNVHVAHIHCAPAGENGPVGLTLHGLPPGGGGLENPAEDIYFVEGEVTAPDTKNGCGWADLAAAVEAMRSGNTYVNVHSYDSFDPFADPGETRGQIEAAAH
jgi:hypothetical protein